MTFPFFLHCTCSVFFRPCEKAIYREKQCLYVIIKKYPVLCDNLEGWEVGGRFKREGTYIYLWLIHVDGWQKPTQYCKAIILQLKTQYIF